MAVYVDDWRQQARVGRLNARWSHLTADSDDELHAFAKRLGLRPEWAQDMDHINQHFRHYDVTEKKRELAIRLGAVPQTWRDAGKRMLKEGRRLRRLAELASDTDRFYTIGEIAKFINIDKSTAKRSLKKGEIPKPHHVDDSGKKQWSKDQVTDIIQTATNRGKKNAG